MTLIVVEISFAPTVLHIPPNGIPTLTQWWGLCGHMILRAMLAVAYATGRVSHARQVKGDDPDKKGYPSPPVWGFGVGLTTQHSKKLIVTKVKQRNKLDRFNDDEQKRTKYAEITLATWNVQTMLKPEKMKEVMEEIGKARVDVVAVQEICWQGQGIIRGLSRK